MMTNMARKVLNRVREYFVSGLQKGMEKKFEQLETQLAAQNHLILDQLKIVACSSSERDRQVEAVLLRYVTHLEKGIVARFEALNQRLDQDVCQSLERKNDTSYVRGEIDRLDSYLVYHMEQLASELAEFKHDHDRRMH